MKPASVLLLLSLLMACNLKNERKQIGRYHCERYDYYFYESTGDNQFIDVNGVQHTIRFDKDSSDKDAYTSLFALKWNVLYPNSKGSIKVFGYYVKHDSSFILIHWWLKAPFILHQYIRDTELLNRGSVPLIQKEKLTSEDFDADLNFNPEKYNTELAPNK